MPCIYRLLLTTSALCMSSLAFSNPSHFFIEWHHKERMVELGSFGDDYRTKNIWKKLPLEQIAKQDLMDWLGMERNGAILLFHCMWGQQPLFHQTYLQSFDKVLSNAPTTRINTQISFLWHAGGVMYRRNWKNSDAKGESISILLTYLSEIFTGNMHVFSHSMGNRFFEGMLRNAPPAVRFNSITLFSADLDIKTADADFSRLTSHTDAIYIYMHRKDRTLLISSWLHGKSRLGRSGPDAVIKNLQVIDMTKTCRGLSNHSHFMNTWVQSKLAEQFTRFSLEQDVVIK